jgi:hypothetical protein
MRIAKCDGVHFGRKIPAFGKNCFFHLQSRKFSNLLGASKLFLFIFLRETKGSTLMVAQLVEALRYKPESRGFDSLYREFHNFLRDYEYL